MKWAYYNEFDEYAAQWLRNLMDAGAIAPGVVDERSIEDVSPDDLKGFTQCHFFAGIGVWSHALRKAGWADDRPAWTGSAPCQPFSTAGKRKGFKDERHLWPEFLRLINACHPPIIFGEQVANGIASGKHRGDYVQRLWETRGTLLVCKDWIQRDYQEYLQRVPEQERESVGEGASRQQRSKGKQAGSRRKGESEAQAAGVRFGCGVGEREAGYRRVSTKRPAIRYGAVEGDEVPFTGSNRPQGWIHETEHEIDPVWAERGFRGLGAGRFFPCGASGNEDAIKRIDDLVAQLGEEIERENGSSWINDVFLDLGRSNYTCGACVAPAAGFGAPHIRQRLYWVAHRQAGRGSAACGLADSHSNGCDEGSTSAEAVGQGDSTDTDGGAYRPGPTYGFWGNPDWLLCKDGRWRPIEPGVTALVDEPASRVVPSSTSWRTPAGPKGFGHIPSQVKGYGNAICSVQASAFISAVMEHRP